MTQTEKRLAKMVEGRNNLDRKISDLRGTTETPPACIHCHQARAQHGERGACLAAGYYGNKFDPATGDTLTDTERAKVIAAIDSIESYVDAMDDRVCAAVERILADRRARETDRLCSQCGELMSVMVKVGTTDGWCESCLDEASEGDLRARIEALADDMDERGKPGADDSPMDAQSRRQIREDATRLRTALATDPM